MDTHASNTRLSVGEKIGYGLGDMASNLYLGFFSLFLLYYYTDIFGIDPVAVATMLLIAKIVDAVTDPAMGLIADRTQTRWGKYRPYLVWMALPYGILGYALLLGPDLSPAGKLAYAYVTYIGVMLAYTAINVPYSALLAVISPSAEERTKATQFRFICATVGTLTVSAFASPLASLLGRGDDLVGFRMTMAIFAVLSIVLFLITFATTRERVVPPREDSTVGRDLTLLLRNRSWIVLSFSGILIIVGLVARLASIAYYIKYVVGDAGDPMFWIFDRTSVFTSIGLLGQLVGAIVTPSIVSRMDKHHILSAASLGHAGLLIVFFFLPHDQFVLTTVVHTLGMTTFGVSITLLFAMYTDCAEYGEWRFGRRSSGLVVSASMFSLKFGSAVGGALPGFVLALAGFVANEVQTGVALQGIRAMFTFIPAICFAAGGLLILRYRIDRSTLHQVEHELAERRHTSEAVLAV